jgi:plasmid stabilization system protein ParE
MAEKTIVWTLTAIQQRRHILRYWTIRNGSTKYDEKLVSQIAKQTKTILKHPDSFKLSEFPDTRISELGHFSIYYKVTVKHLIITAFWDNRQDPNSLLGLLNQ